MFLLLSPVATVLRAHTHAHIPDPTAYQSAYSLPQQDQMPTLPQHTHTLTQAYAQNHSSSTPSVPSPHSSHFKWPPKIAQEAIRKNTARGGGGGSCRVLQSKAIGGYQASLSLLFCLFPLSSSLCLALLPLFVPMNQCCSVHAH